MTNPPFDLPRAHRWFAVELNNLTWDLVEAKSRTPAQVERMIHGAHAACFHWLQVGDLLNHLRAQVLLATAYAVAGLSEPAIRHAERCLALSVEAGDGQMAFDRATAHGSASVAYALSGNRERARQEYDRAVSVAANLDPQDRQVFDRLYPSP